MHKISRVFGLYTLNVSYIKYISVKLHGQRLNFSPKLSPLIFVKGMRRDGAARYYTHFISHFASKASIEMNYGIETYIYFHIYRRAFTVASCLHSRSFPAMPSEYVYRRHSASHGFMPPPALSGQRYAYIYSDLMTESGPLYDISSISPGFEMILI